MAVARGDYQVGVVRKFNQFIIDCDWLEVSSSDHVCSWLTVLQVKRPNQQYQST